MADKSNDMERLYVVVGYISVHWAILERALETCITIIYHRCNGKKLVNPELPRSFSQRKEFLKDSFKKIPALAPFKKEGLSLVSKAAHMAEKRAALVHGVVTKFESVNDVFHFYRLKTYEHNHLLRKEKLDLRTVPSLKAELEGLITMTVNFAILLSNTFLLHKQ